MKKVIASILSLALLSGLFVNSSFAEEIQPPKVTQEKASDVLNLENQKSSFNISDSIDKGEPVKDEIPGQPEPNKTSAYKEKNIEKLKKDLEMYNEKQQKLIQKYENMTDKGFYWAKTKSFFIKTLAAFLIVGVFVVTYSFGVDDSFHEGRFCRRENIDYQFGYVKGLKKGEKERQENQLSPTKCSNIIPGTKEIVRKFLSTLHPDYFKRGKTFNDVKELYDDVTNFCNKHFRKPKRFWFI